MSSVSIIERRILEAVRDAGEKGLLQRELWKILGIDSRNGARIVRRLEQQGYLTREAVMYKGRKTYIIRITKKVLTPITVDFILKSIPCFTCEYLERCGEGAEINPIKCKKINKWLSEYVRKKEEGN